MTWAADMRARLETAQLTDDDLYKIDNFHWGIIDLAMELQSMDKLPIEVENIINDSAGRFY